MPCPRSYNEQICKQIIYEFDCKANILITYFDIRKQLGNKSFAVAIFHTDCRDNTLQCND